MVTSKKLNLNNMSPKYKIILVILFFSIQNTTNALIRRDPPDHLAGGGESTTYSLVFIVVGLFFASVTRLIVKNFQIPMPTSAFTLFVGLGWGILIYYFPYLKQMSTILYVHPDHLAIYVIPVIIFRTALCIDAHTFLKSLTQILIQSVFGSIISSCFVGFFLTLILDFKWSYSVGIMFGTLSTPIYPLEIVSCLKDIGHQTKYLAVLLEGESLIGLSTCNIMFNIVMGIIEGYFTKWYHVVIFIFKYILGGTLVGYVIGKITCCMVNAVYNDVINVILISIVSPFLGFYICEQFLYSCGIICVLIIGVMMSIERTALSSEVDHFLTNFWEMFAYITTVTVYIMFASYFAVSILFYMEIRDCAILLVTYVLVNLGRFIGYLVLAPIVSRTGYGLTFRHMLVAVWGGLKHTVILCFLLKIYNHYVMYNLAREFLLYLLGLCICTLTINAPITPTLLRVMGLSQLSLARQANMNNCMKFVLAKRERCIAMLKMDRQVFDNFHFDELSLKNRFLSDANWPIVNKTTNMKHPYKINFEENEEDDLYSGYGFAICPDCKREVLHQPSVKEFREMTREARLRILKAKKVSYTRQYEYGMISRDGIRILSQAVEIAMDTDKAIIELEGLHRLFKKEGCSTKMRNLILKLFFKKSENLVKPPRKYWRRVCYHIIMHPAFEIFIFTAVALNIIPITLELAYAPKRSTFNYVLRGLSFFFFLIYLSEFLLKIYGYSWIHICQHGFRTYFHSFWNVFDFLVLCTAVMDLILDVIDLSWINFEKSDSIASKITLIGKSLRIIRFVKLCSLCKAFYPKAIKYFDSKIDTNMAFAYDVGKGYVAGEEEVLEMLPHMIDNAVIRDDMRIRMEADRLAITKELGLVQKDRPWIAITVKTRQAIKTVLNVMLDAINELKISGWVEDVEYMRLVDSLNERHKVVRSVNSIQPSSPKVIFKEIPWMPDNKNLTEFLYENVTTKIFEPGDVICEENKITEGIFIIATGLFLLTYTPKLDNLKKLAEYGALPIVDYLASVTFDRKIEDYIVSGNCIGELGTITRRPYNCTIVADSHCQVYVLTKDIIKEAMELDSDPIKGLECKIWKSISIRIAMAILAEVPTYQSTNKSKIKYALERAFVPKLSHFKMFVVNEMMEDIILLEGIAVDFNTMECYIAPCYVPRTVQRLILPKSSQITVATSIETKLMIIPTKDINEYDIMIHEEDIAEMISIASSKCLYHLVQNKIGRTNRKKRGTLHVTGQKLKHKPSDHSSTKASTRSRMESLHETEVNNINMNKRTSKQSGA